MKKTKQTKITPVIVTSREGMEARVADIVRLKLEFAEATAVMEQEIAEVQKRHQDRLLGLVRDIDVNEVGVQIFCERNREALFADKKSLDLLLATVGFELTPHRVEKVKDKEKWEKIALRLGNLEWGQVYLRESDPEVDKAGLLADRTKLKADQLAEAGIRFAQDENFFIRPKSAVAEASVKEAEAA